MNMSQKVEESLITVNIGENMAWVETSYTF